MTPLELRHIHQFAESNHLNIAMLFAAIRLILQRNLKASEIHELGIYKDEYLSSGGLRHLLAQYPTLIDDDL